MGLNYYVLGLGAVAALILLFAVIAAIFLLPSPSKPQPVAASKPQPVAASKQEEVALNTTTTTPSSSTTSTPTPATRSPSVVKTEVSLDTSSGLRRRVSATSPSTSELPPSQTRRPSLTSRVVAAIVPTTTTPPHSPKSTQVVVDSQPPLITPCSLLDGHFDSVESLAFSRAEEGLFCTGGGPEDGSVRVYDKSSIAGEIGPLRHVIDVRADCEKHDAAASLAFCLDAGKKTTLLLVGTKTERFLMGYKISKSRATPPQLMFRIPTAHGGAITSVCGYIPPTAINYSDAGVFFVTSALGTREVKLWSVRTQKTPLLVIDAECWASELRLSADGRFLAILSRGGGAGHVYELKQDVKPGSMKAVRCALAVPISDTIANASLPRVAKASEFTACQDLQFDSQGEAESEGRCKVACCRADSTVWMGSARPNRDLNWDLQVLAKPEVLTGPSQVLLMVKNRRTGLVVARGKDVVFFDASLLVLGVLRGRREDGDVVGMALSPAHDLLVVVAFGGSVARVVQVV